jgi:hypothetical protein
MRTRLAGLGVALAAALPLLLGLAASASAQGRWMPSKMLSDQAAIEPRVTITGTGEGIAAWGVRGPDVTIPGDAVSASVRLPGGQFGNARVISPNNAIFVDMAANDAGAVAIGYNADGKLNARVRPALGDFAEPVAFPEYWGQVVVDGAGNVTVLMRENERVNTETEVSKHVAYHLKTVTHFADGRVGAPQHIASAYEISGEDIATDAAGHLTVGWRQADGEGPNRRVMVATGSPEGGFDDPRELYGPRPEQGDVRVAASPRGDVLVAWGTKPYYDNSDSQSPAFSWISVVPHSSYRPPGGDFGPVEVVEGLPQHLRGMYRWDLAIDRAGNSAVAWSNAHGGGVAYRPTEGSWKPQPLGSHSLEPTVTFDGKGTATAAYVEGGTPQSSQRTVKAVRRARSDDAFGAPAELARGKHFFGPDSAADPLGNTIVVWSHQERWGWSPERTERGIGSAIWDFRAPSVTDFELDPDGDLPGSAPEFDFGLNEAASVTVTVERTASRAKPVRLAKLKGRAARGMGDVTIDPKLAKRLGSKASYRATIVARDSSGRSSKPRRLTFRRLAR